MMLKQDDIWSHLDNLTKPPRSLGRLEELAARLCLIQQTLTPKTSPRRLVIFAGDHGVVDSGVTVWPSEVTGLMIENIRSGTAASSVLACSTKTEIVLVNVGVLGRRDHAAGEPATASCPDSPLSKDGVGYRDCRVRAGTGNLAYEPAMTVAEFDQSLEIGKREARAAASDGIVVVAAGEMGIGNTTPSACLAMLLADIPLEKAVGRGAGADEKTMARKRQVVREAVHRARQSWSSEPISAIAEIAGLEIVSMAGFFIEAKAAGLTVVVDGYVAGAAALIADRLSPGVSDSMIAAHLSAETGHRQLLQRLGLTPYLQWDLRLGEGTGALLLMPLLDAAAAMASQMATFQELGIERHQDVT